jgi:SP family xylose:H+ symportor-like MFS transporter
MNQKYNTLPYVYRLTFVATIGGLLFGYDTAVVSGAVRAIHEFFVVPLSFDPPLAGKTIDGYRIIIGSSALVIALAVSGMLIKLFGRRKGLFLGFLLLGIVALIFLKQYSKPVDISYSDLSALTGFTVSSALIGCVVGGSFGGFISTTIGRKKGLILAALLFLISGTGSAFPEKMGFWGMQPLVSFVFYRIAGGIGIGLASMLSPMYIAEISPARIRGRLVSWNQFAIVLGILLVYFVNWFIAKHGDEEWNMTTGWRWMFLSGVIPSSIFLILLLFVPETPRYLVLKNNYTRAKKILVKSVGEEEAEASLKDILQSLVNKSSRWLYYGWLLIIVSVLMAVFQQFAGINVVMYYAPKIFQNTGTRLDVSLLQTVLVGVVNMLFTIIAIASVDRFGRKALLILGGLIMGSAMAAIGFTFYSKSMGLLALVFILVYIAGFAMSWGPVMWVVISEIFPNPVRGAMSIATAAVWLADLTVSWTFPMLDDNLWLTASFHHGFAYWIYAVVCILAVIFVWLAVPETKGKTLEQIETFWKRPAS